MNIEQAKTKLNSVSNSTAIKHPKVLISELCSVIKFLLEQLDCKKIPPFVLKETRSLPDLKEKNKPDIRLPWINPGDPIFGKTEPKKRTGNAGDAK